MQMIGFQPVSIVEDEGFRLYTETLNPEYTLSCRKTLSEVLILKHYNIKEKLMGMLQVIDPISITDLWSSITVTGHSIHDFTFYSVVLATSELIVSHTSKNISEAILSILERFNITHIVVTVVTGNGSNMKKVISENLRKYNHFYVAHTLNLSIQDAITENKEFVSVLTKCRTL